MHENLQSTLHYRAVFDALVARMRKHCDLPPPVLTPMSGLAPNPTLGSTSQERPVDRHTGHSPRAESQYPPYRMHRVMKSGAKPAKDGPNAFRWP